MSEYKHQCRYCAHCVYTLNETFWCEELSKDCVSEKRPNKCKSFLFNECAADATDWSVTYKPRRKSQFKQDLLFDMPTDIQRGIVKDRRQAFDNYCKEIIGTELCLANCMGKTCTRYIKCHCRDRFNSNNK